MIDCEPIHKPGGPNLRWNGRFAAYAATAWCQRHLQPVARAGGWPLSNDLKTRFAGELVIVSSAADEKAALAAGAWGTVLMEHGAGQSYQDPMLPADSVWRGGRGLAQGRKLFLAPGQLLAKRHRDAHPHIPVEVIGSPAMDVWQGRQWLPTRPRPVVCLSGHWDCQTLPETRSAWPWVKEALPELAADPRWELILHHHPFERQQVLDEKLATCQRLGIRLEPSWQEVLESVDLFVTDNSSTLYEFAATGRPVVALNPPWYRRSARHGLRFWQHVPGLQVHDLTSLNATVAEALTDPPAAQAVRREAVLAAFTWLDGRATERAVQAIRRFGLEAKGALAEGPKVGSRQASETEAGQCDIQQVLTLPSIGRWKFKRRF